MTLEGVRQLGPALAANTLLRQLDLEGNDLRGSSKQDFFEGLIRNKTQLKLNLSRNLLGRDGGVHLAKLEIVSLRTWMSVTARYDLEWLNFPFSGTQLHVDHPDCQVQ